MGRHKIMCLCVNVININGSWKY